MSRVLYFYCSLDTAIHLFDYNRLPVLYEDSYWLHEHLYLTEQDDAWELGEFRVELFDSFEENNTGTWVDKCGYIQNEVDNVIRWVKDICYREKVTVPLAGRMFMTNKFSRFGKLYFLAEIILQEQLTVKQAESWEKYAVFCEQNSGYIFPSHVQLIIMESGVSIEECVIRR